MTRCVAALLAILAAAVPLRDSRGADPAPPAPFDSLLAWYRQTYSFISMDDTIYTFETEFRLPEGFHRPDSAALTGYQYWVSHLPLWNQWKPVGVWKGGKAYEYGEVSRVVHMPWRGTMYTDIGFPLRVFAEYCRYAGRESAMHIVTRADGDTLAYAAWLQSKVSYTPLGGPRLVPATPREASEMEFYRFLTVAMEQQTYQTLAANCDSLPPEEVRPGDLVIGHDDRLLVGKVYIVVNMLVNDEGERMYTVATGCPKPNACDLHIPLLTPDRHSPWITPGHLAALVDDLPQWGFFRLRGSQ
ncbi:MAG TPA: DUF4846 domain-containing protein [candidate division Zixibacteria bacterium]|nr:hypothetical protein [candidate division Zixibacteria bacterium]MDD4917363.1 DUF4846 domain-containing protein [candidate division Zixibacteria bacterium]MDM7971921.1 DUF4846 domain-containing protein [candidate division Zixibacteria bacterium]HOD66245.1 DUF4846 domain-containing protein [candidate division Zixibacteria bacterium]HOZ06699.1 DUF4846 domain-containing protein [candidate division Zixibacteria bacterium]